MISVISFIVFYLCGFAPLREKKTGAILFCQGYKTDQFLTLLSTNAFLFIMKFLHRLLLNCAAKQEDLNCE